MGKTCVLIPAYNEAKIIGDVISKIGRLGLDVMVVDDGSTDETAARAKEAGASVIKHSHNKGKGASIREGVRHILAEPYDAVIIMDGDGQHNPDEISVFLKRAEEGSSFIIGNRMSNTESMPWVRYFTNRIMSVIISLICRQHVPDTQCGYKFITRDALEKLNLASSRYDIETEILIEAARSGVRIDSVPIKTIYRREESYIRPIVDTFRFLRLLVSKLLKKTANDENGF